MQKNTTIGIVKNDDNVIVEKRIKFIKNEIQKRTNIYKNILLKQKDFLINKIEKKKSFSKNKDEDLLRIVFDNFDEEWLPILRLQNEEALKNAVLFAGKEAISQVGANISFELEHERAMQWINENALKHAQSIIDSIKDEVKERILIGLQEGLGAEDIADKIREFFDKQSGWRALRNADRDWETN